MHTAYVAFVSIRRPRFRTTFFNILIWVCPTSNRVTVLIHPDIGEVGVQKHHFPIEGTDFRETLSRDNHHYRIRCYAVVPTGFAVDGVVDLLGPRTGDEVAHQIYLRLRDVCAFLAVPLCDMYSGGQSGT